MEKKFNIINGNSYEELKKFPDNYFDSVVTDPPYGLGKEPNANEMLKAWVETGYMEVSGKGFMGKEWDAFVPQPIFWKEVFRVLKPGGHIVAFYGTRTYDWGVMAMRLAEFEIRDSLQWCYGSGFPKSYNVAKGIEGKIVRGSSSWNEWQNLDGEKEDRQLGYFKMNDEQGNRPNNYENGQRTSNINYTTEQAKQWDGWGSALKPAVEPVVLARKPLEKGLSIAENVLKWGTGAINIDKCRVNTSDNLIGNGTTKKFVGSNNNRDYDGERIEYTQNANGRFPANLLMSHHPDCEFKGMKKVKGQIDKPTNRTKFEGTWNESNTGFRNNTNLSKEGYGDENGEETIEDWNCHEDCPIKIMDEQSGDSKSQRNERGNIINNNIYGKYNEQENTERGHNDSGGASRFFYTAKASKSERNFGLHDFEKQMSGTLNCNSGDLENYGGMSLGGASLKGEHKNPIPKANIHPTVKPVKLMQYLVRLITPPNGKVLDPFNGSGTTGIACCLEKFDYTGIELSEEYCNISRARITAWNEIEEYEDYKKIIENQDDEEDDQNRYGVQGTLF